MLNGQNKQDDKSGSNVSEVRPPAISLPKGGGAIRGVGEKFAANPVTGTGSITVPIAVSPGRSGFGPQLSLAYDSGAGNGTFGFGWNLSLPAITRKTDKGLPQYRDAEESDVFILSGAEDLVPVLVEAEGQWQPETLPPRIVDGKQYQIKRYRPRIEGLFARIERWTNEETGETHWRSISRDNITTLYGASNQSRIFDPSDPDQQHPTRIFSWLICESYDDKGNAILYEYKEENSDGVDLSQVHEKNRTPSSRGANRYLKYIKYGNRVSRLVQPDLSQTEWLFEVGFDYGEHDPDNPKPGDVNEWLCRHDPFSSYRAGFEARTYRLCQRVLMFHHFPDEQGVGQDCLVRSTDFVYRSIRDNSEDFSRGHPIASFIASITQAGYKRQPDSSYLRKSLPPVEFEYSQALVNEDVRAIESDSVENLPYGLDGTLYEWVDLDGEGTSGILTRQAGGWFYKRNLSPFPVTQENGPETTVASFAPTELVTSLPSLAASPGRQQFLDLAGDGQIDLVQLDSQMSGFYERTDNSDWLPFVPFESVPNIAWDDPNLKFVDLTGDGHADILISEDDVFVWYQSRAEEGFAPAERVRQALEEEEGPRLVFADVTQSIYLADLSGDGLTDLVRLRSGEVCYWPNLGYGHFGAKVTMDNSPRFDPRSKFDQQRIRLADIDGSGVTDIIYLGRDGVHLYFNQSGNSWSEAHTLEYFPQIDNLSTVTVTDLLGNGTACLVWSSPLPSHARRPMRYVDLMGGQKPHLLVRSVNNLGAETVVNYAPSTKFYLQDKQNAKPWITRLSFPVHCVERVETYDQISRNRFVTRYAYHHGYFDGEEREFRGFGMVEQWDTEEFAALTASQQAPIPTNVERASHVPPVLTRTWFHTGVYFGRDHISDFFAGLLDHNDSGEYYREPGLNDAQARELLLDDTLLPHELTSEEEREACRALRGSMLRQEVYALDGSDKEQHPYTVTEQNFTIRRLQPSASNRHGVFFTHAREVISYHYERNPVDPRISHALTLEVDEFGNVLKSAAVGYGRRQADPTLSTVDADKQTRTLVTYTENRFTNSIDSAAGDDYRAPLPCESSTYELTGFVPSTASGRFQFADFVAPGSSGLTHVFDSEINYEDQLATGRQRRLIERVRTHYRRNNLSACLPLTQLESLALPCEAYKLAFTPGLLSTVYQRRRHDQPPENLLPDPATILPGQGPDQGGYVDLDGDGHWWIPSGKVFYAPNVNPANSAITAAQELAEARQHLFLPRQLTDPFGHSATVDYQYDLLVIRTRDPLDNAVQAVNDYRVLQPRLVTDPNGNRTEITFDVLGMVAGTAVMGKETENLGDSLAGFPADLTPQQINDFFNSSDPHVPAPGLLGNATTRIIYDLDQFRRTRQAHPNDPTEWLPVYAATLARETHASDPLPPDGLRVQIGFSYSDGFGREIQKKMQAEPGPLVEGGPSVSPRWVGTGWTIFNNKGKPVRQYEPFFSQLAETRHYFEFGVQVGVSPIVFYDPPGRAVSILHPNHSFEKVVFDPWQQTNWDVNDTVLLDPRTDHDIRGFTENYFAALNPPPGSWQTWHARRQGGGLGVDEQTAATKAAVHADTPSVAYVDTLGRPFLTVVDNGRDSNDNELKYRTRVSLDIEGNQREVIDAKNRIVMRYDYDMLGRRSHQAGMEAGKRWVLNDVAGKPIRAWDDRGHELRTDYDEIRRPVRGWVRGADVNTSDPQTFNQDVLFERTEYGEGQPSDTALNLRTRVFRHYDSAGIVTSMGLNPVTDRDEAYDFKGNLLRGSRQLAQDYTVLPDWSASVQLETDVYRISTAYDALNRPVTITAPDGSATRPTYNEANLLERLDVNLRGEQTNGQPVWTAFVVNVDYNAKGQRTLISYGNGAESRYRYDPETFRLTNLYTRRGAAFTEDCGGNPPSSRFAAPALPPPRQSCGLQNLQYTYDAVGNITHIRDEAQQTVYFRNHRVEPHSDYTYDALYRLIAATGREHLGQNAAGEPLPPSASSYNDASRVSLLDARDGNAMGGYRQQYMYDEVGNFLETIHRGTDPRNPGWTRTYTDLEDSLLEPGKQSNRLTSTNIGAAPEIYSTNGDGYDPHGNMLRMPHLQIMQWDFNDQLRTTQRQAVDGADEEGLQRQGERTYYVYDAAGQRVRKVTELASGQLKDDRVYLAGFEIYRRQGVNAVVRETLHIMDDKQRIAVVETRTQGNDASPEQFIRYQFGNHLGSTSLELDYQAQIISYEEYYPYGNSSYRAVRSGTESPKRYRYSGKERDEESGFYYHGARYYIAWLGRWLSPDPAGLVDGTNLYEYGRGNPLRFTDPSGTAAESELLNLQENLAKARTDYEKLIQSPVSPHLTQAALEYEVEYGRIKDQFAKIGQESDALESRIQGQIANTRGGELGISSGSGGELSRAPIGEGTLSLAPGEGQKTSPPAVGKPLPQTGIVEEGPTQAARSLPEQLDNVCKFRTQVRQAAELVNNRKPLSEAGSELVDTSAKSLTSRVKPSAGSIGPGRRGFISGDLLTAPVRFVGSVGKQLVKSQIPGIELYEYAAALGAAGGATLGVRLILTDLVVNAAPAVGAVAVPLTALAIVGLVSHETYQSLAGLSRATRDPSFSLAGGRNREPLLETPLPSAEEVENIQRLLGGS